jgi:MFS family permease
MAMMLAAFSEERQSVIQGWSSVANTLAPSLGMLVGGYVAEYHGWRVLFSAPVIPVSIAFAAAIYILPDDNAKRTAIPRGRFDYEGTLVLAAATTLMLLGVNQRDVRLLIAAALLLPLLAAIEGRSTAPILPKTVLGTTDVALALSWRFVRNGMYMALFIIIPLYLRDGCGLGASETTLLMFPRPLAIGIMAPVTGELLQTQRFRGHERWLLLVAAMVSIWDKILGVAVVWWDTHTTFVLEAMLIIQGATTGVMSVAVRMLVMGSVVEGDRGNAQGIINMVSSISSSLGMAGGVSLVGSSAANAAATRLASSSDETWAPAAATLAVAPDNEPHASPLAGDGGRFRMGMTTVLCIYLTFIFLPVWLYHRRVKPKPPAVVRNISEGTVAQNAV